MCGPEVPEDFDLLVNVDVELLGVCAEKGVRIIL